MNIALQSIGIVHNDRKQIEDDYWGDIVSKIELNSQLLEPTSTQGLECFSHVEIVFYMDQVKPEKIVTHARHPRNDHSLPKFGILAQRGKNRPNQIGVSFAELRSVEGLTLVVQGLDAINGTPILDIKPCFAEFLPRGEIKQAEWTYQLMAHYY